MLLIRLKVLFEIRNKSAFPNGFSYLHIIYLLKYESKCFIQQTLKLNSEI